MKTKVTIYMLFCLTLFFSGCFSPWDGGDVGNLTISIGNGARATTDWSESVNYLHVITVFRPDGIKHEKRFIGNTASTTFSVPTGHWNVTVKGYSLDSDADGKPYSAIYQKPLTDPIEEIDLENFELMSEGFAKEIEI